jgi:protein-tyrosine-phosphatase
VDPNAPPRNDVLSILEMHSIRSYRHRARRVTKDDLKTYEWVFAMHNTVLAELQTLRTGIENKALKKRGFVGRALGCEEAQLARTMLIGAWRDGSGGEEVVDPVFRPLVETQKMYNQISRLCGEFLNFLAVQEKKEEMDKRDKV